MPVLISFPRCCLFFPPAITYRCRSKLPSFRQPAFCLQPSPLTTTAKSSPNSFLILPMKLHQPTSFCNHPLMLRHRPSLSKLYTREPSTTFPSYHLFANAFPLNRHPSLPSPFSLAIAHHCWSSILKSQLSPALSSLPPLALPADENVDAMASCEPMILVQSHSESNQVNSKPVN